MSAADDRRAAFADLDRVLARHFGGPGGLARAIELLAERLGTLAAERALPGREYAALGVVPEYVRDAMIRTLRRRMGASPWEDPVVLRLLADAEAARGAEADELCRLAWRRAGDARRRRRGRR